MKFTEARRFPIIANFICFVVALVVSAVFLLHPLHSVQRGFFCDDASIRFPYRGNTISIPLLVVTCFLPAVLVVLALETTYGVLTVRFATAKETSSAGNGVAGGAATTVGGSSNIGVGVGGVVDNKSCWDGLRTGLGRGGVLTGCLFYGNCLCFSLTEVFKLSFGTLRPSFLSACRPLVPVTSLPNCSGLFIQDIVCQNTDTALMIDMRKSFISGHASFAVYNMFFIMLYLQRRLPVSTPRLLVSLLQSVAVGYAVLVCASRIFDHYHHPQDVVGGAVLGLLTCWVTMFKICPAVIRHPPRAHLDLLPTQAPKQSSGPQGSSKQAPTSVQLTSVQTKE